jgi:hypothetical protein
MNVGGCCGSMAPLTGDEDLLYTRDLSYAWVNSWGFALTKETIFRSSYGKLRTMYLLSLKLKSTSTY